MNGPVERPPGWVAKFRAAGRGIALALGEGSSYAVHVPMALAVVGVATWLQIDAVRWCALALAIGVVLAAEIMNSALERLARAITSDHHPEIRDALDQASGAVLAAAISAAIVGLIVFAAP